MSDQEIEELRALVVSSRKKRHGPFPREVSERLQSYLKKKWRSGASLAQLGAQLGLSDSTVSYWRSHWGERDKKGGQLRRVEVVAEKGKTARAVTVHGPCGTRLEGLSLGEVAELWRKLSC